MSSTTRDQDQQLCQVVEAIPPGQWMTYRDVATLAGHYWQHDTAGINQQLIRVGCAGAHRVLQSDGSIFSLALGDPEKVRRALRREGVDFDAGRADPSARVSINPQHSPAPTAAQAADAAVEAFWQEIGRQYPGLPGDYQPSALDKDFSGLAMLLVEQWLDGKVHPRLVAWNTIVAYQDVTFEPGGGEYNGERFALVQVEEGGGRSCASAFAEFDDLRAYAGDQVLDGWLPVVAYDLELRKPIDLHVSTPKVTIAEDQMSANPFDA